MKTVLGITLALVLGWTSATGAAESVIGATQAWARATGPDTPTGMVFLTLTNSGAEADRLVSATTPTSAKVEFHRHVQTDGSMKMQRQDSIELPPGASIRFSPGGLHVMLDGLKTRLAAGQTLTLSLSFAKSAPISVAVPVIAQGAPPPTSAPAMPDHDVHDPAMHEQHMKDPAHKAMHEQHMKDPDHRAMHEQMHGPAK